MTEFYGLTAFWFVGMVVALFLQITVLAVSHRNLPWRKLEPLDVALVVVLAVFWPALILWVVLTAWYQTVRNRS